MGSGPTRSVVLASRGERRVLDSVLAVLLPACRDLEVELVVVRVDTTGELIALGKDYPTIRFIPAAPHLSIAELKSLGASQTTADIVSLTDETVAGEENWAETLIRRSCLFTGGLPESEPPDWALLLTEWGVREPT